MDELLEKLGLIVDTCENFMANDDNPFMPDKMKLDAYRHGIKQVRDELKKIYLDNGGEDVWS